MLFLLIINILLIVLLVILGIFIYKAVHVNYKLLNSSTKETLIRMADNTNNINKHLYERTENLNEKSATNYKEIICLHDYIESLEARLISNFKDIDKYFADAKDCLANINKSVSEVKSEMQSESKSKERYATISSKVTRIKEDTVSIAQYLTEIDKKISLQSENVLNSIKTLKTSKSSSKAKKSVVDNKTQQI